MMTYEENANRETLMEELPPPNRPAHLRMDLLPPEMLIAVSNVMTHGVAKYGADYPAPTNYGEQYAKAMEHLTKWWSGETTNPKSGLPHLAHAVARISFLMTFENRGEGTDDRPMMFQKAAFARTIPASTDENGPEGPARAREGAPVVGDTGQGLETRPVGSLTGLRPVLDDDEDHEAMADALDRELNQPEEQQWLDGNAEFKAKLRAHGKALAADLGIPFFELSRKWTGHRFTAPSRWTKADHEAFDAFMHAYVNGHKI